ncbi:MAG: CaiB/BaiF CoA transferase family protein, partial [Acidimicrobiales bacterium]
EGWDGEPFAGQVDGRGAGTTSATASASATAQAANSAEAFPALLEGVKILDLGAYFAGPYSSRLLADLGADVIKLEPTQGDQLRGIDQCFFPAQAGKRSLAMDLKDPGAQPIMEALLDWADVVHHNLRPGAAERLGLAYDDIRRAHPDLIYLYAPGWGSGGPDMLRQSFAPMMSGYVGVTFEAAGQFNEPLPTPCNEDPGNGMLGAACIVMGLLHRRRTARGMYIENPQLNATMSHMAHVVRRVGPAGTGNEVLGAARLDTLQYGFGPFERLYRTADGWICIAALDESSVSALAEMFELDLAKGGATDPADVMAARIEERGTATWLAAFESAGVPAVEPVARNTHAFLNDPENRRTGRVAECHHPTRGNVRELAQLVRVSESTHPPHRLAPDLGAHTESILRTMGRQPEEIADLRARGAIRT